MSNERLSVALENGRFAKVTMWQNEPRLDLRQWEIGQTNNKPTKKGISLKLHQVKTLNNGMESIQESLKKNEDLKWHLGMNVYASVQKDNPCVDIRQYWKRPQLDESVPTKKGLCFRPQEFDIFLKHWEEIIKAMPELEKFVACYDPSDHFNQLGMLSCQACNPDGWENW